MPIIIMIWDPPTDKGDTQTRNCEIRVTFNQEKADENSDNNNKKSPGKIINSVVWDQSDPFDRDRSLN